MAGPIRISILADAGQAIKSVTKFSDVVDSETKRVVTTLGDSKLQGGFGKIQEGFDVADTRAMGFRDTITGVQDTLSGVKALMGEGEAANKSFGDKLVLLGTGVGDLASGFANFIVPLAAVAASMNTLSLTSARATVATVAQKAAMLAGSVATGAMTAAQWLFNAALSANPIGIVIIAIVALVAAVVIAYKKSETFRNVVQAVWAGIKTAVGAAVSFIVGAAKGLWNAMVSAWNGIKAAGTAAWSAIKSFVSGAISGIKSFVSNLGTSIAATWNRVKSGASSAWNAVKQTISNVVSGVVSKVRELPGNIKGAFSNAGGLLVSAGRNIVEGLWSGISGLGGWLSSKVSGFISSSIPGPVKKALGIASPSRLMRKYGKFTGQGLGLGIIDSIADVKRASKLLVSKGIISAQGAGIASLKKTLEAQRTVINDLKKSRAEYATSIADSVRGGGITSIDLVAGERSFQKDFLVQGLRDRLAAIKAFQSNIARLSKRGLSTDIIRQIADSGLETGGKYLAALQDATPAYIRQINSLNNAIARSSSATGNSVSRAVFDQRIANASKLTIDNKLTLKLDTGGNKWDQALLESLRKAVRTGGGNVQVVLGKA